MTGRLDSAMDVQERLDALDYIVDEGLATALYLSLRLGMPLLLEGEPGVGKTTAAKVLSRVLESPLLRLQCYQGLTASEALYEWNYQRQLLAIRLAESRHRELSDSDLFTTEFLQARPLLQCVQHEGSAPPVLLIDEIDRADDEFEALLLEFLGESSVTIPELGTVVAAQPPIVVLTSNRSRDLHDALRRRCLYHWIAFPSSERMVDILRRTVPGADDLLIDTAAAFTGRVRELDLDKTPGMAEAINWVSALTELGTSELSADSMFATLGTLAKTPDDRNLVVAMIEDEFSTSGDG